MKVPAKWLILILCVVLACAGCNGGGGGGSDPAAVEDTETGTEEEAPAAITSGIAEELLIGIYTGSAVSLQISSCFSSIKATTDPQFISGICGGSIIVSGAYNNVTGEITDGEASFNNFCNDEIRSTGKVSFSGKIDPGTDDISLNIICKNLVVTSLKYIKTVNGTATYASTGECATIIGGDYTVRDNKTLKTSRFGNAAMEICGPVMTLSCRYVHPDYGYVDVSTQNPLMTSSSGYPSEGVLVIKGNADSRARLIAGLSTYVIDVDADGNGSYDWNSGSLCWGHLSGVVPPSNLIAFYKEPDKSLVAEIRGGAVAGAGDYRLYESTDGGYTYSQVQIQPQILGSSLCFTVPVSRDKHFKVTSLKDNIESLKSLDVCVNYTNRLTLPAFAITSPLNSQTGVSVYPMFTWNQPPGAGIHSYLIRIEKPDGVGGFIPVLMKKYTGSATSWFLNQSGNITATYFDELSGGALEHSTSYRVSIMGFDAYGSCMAVSSQSIGFTTVEKP